MARMNAAGVSGDARTAPRSTRGSLMSKQRARQRCAAGSGTPTFTQCEVDAAGLLRRLRGRGRACRRGRHPPNRSEAVLIVHSAPLLIAENLWTKSSSVSSSSSARSSSARSIGACWWIEVGPHLPRLLDGLELRAAHKLAVERDRRLPAKRASPLATRLVRVVLERQAQVGLAEVELGHGWAHAWDRAVSAPSRAGREG